MSKDVDAKHVNVGTKPVEGGVKKDFWKHKSRASVSVAQSPMSRGGDDSSAKHNEKPGL